MNLTTAALRRPLTVVAVILGLVLTAFVALKRMPRDIFPDLGVPVIYVAQPYGGLDPVQMDGFVTYYYEYHFLYIAGIEHVESKSIQGAALIKLQFHPGTNMGQAMAETIAYVNRARAFMPPGTVPPFVTRFDAGSVPVGQLVFASESRTVAELQDAALNKVRPLFATLPGVSAPPPFGGSARSVVVHADPDKLRAYRLSPDEIVAAVSSANLIAPSGNLRIGAKMPFVPTNATVSAVKELESVPIRARVGGGPMVYLRDVATVEDGSDIQTGIGLVNGRRTVYIPVTKRADASTLSVVEQVKANLGKFQSVLPEDVKVAYQFDQSPYVTGAISNLLTESLLGALLTGVMVLLFLRDLRSALVVVLNIPLALLVALIGLWLSGQTINLMTLGGLALAVGVLVDEATVTIENLHAHRARGETLARAAKLAAAETAAPRLLAMLCILAVFTPALFMTGAAKALFTPLSLAVGFAMVASWLLSSTLVPILSVWLLRKTAPESPPTATRYQRLLEGLVRARGALVGVYLLLSVGLLLTVGRGIPTEIFPRVDGGQLLLRLRAPAGTRIEKTEEYALRALEAVNAEAGAKNIEATLGFIGVQPPSFPVNLVHLWTGGPHEAVLQIQLKKNTHVAVEPLKERLRARLAGELPSVSLSFEPADIISRVMSFGSPTPIEIAIAAPSLPVARDYAEKVKAELAKIAALRDLQLSQALDYPTVQINVDRERAASLGMTTADVIRSAVPATSSSRFTVPNYWADPKSGIAYQVQVDLPIPQMSSLESLQNVPVAGKSGETALLRDVATITPGTAPGEYARYNSQRIVTLTATIAGSDLAGVVSQVEQAIKAAGVPPPKTTLAVRGQVPTLTELLEGLQSGFLVAVGVILLLLAASFQSVRLALTVLVSLPAVVVGVVLALRLSGTSVNIQSYMGAIMAVGVAVANAILLVTFAERARLKGKSASEAAVEGALSRLRPILMTSLAMIAGMLPMALGLGEGGPQTAPLGRAVIGGLAAATLATLFILPAAFALVQGRVSKRSASLDPDDPESGHFTGEIKP